MKKTNLFFETFVSEYVEIVQDYEVTHSVSLTDDGPTEMKVPMTVAGFVMDSDDTFLYLGPDGESVTQAIPISSIKHIGIVEVTDPVQDILDDMPDPEDKKNYN